MTPPAGAATAVSRVGVVGGGLMGSGIAQMAAQAGLTTIVRELTDALCERTRGSIAKLDVTLIPAGSPPSMSNRIGLRLWSGQAG